MPERKWFGFLDSAREETAPVIAVRHASARLLTADRRDAGERTVITVNYTVGGVWEGTVKDFGAVEIPNTSHEDREGAPAVPKDGIFVAVPDDATDIEVRVTNKSLHEMDAPVYLVPAPKQFRESEYQEVYEPDAAIYDSDDPYPGKDFDFLGLKRMDGVSVVHLLAYLGQYQPVSRRLKIVKEMTLEVSFRTPPSADRKVTRKPRSSATNSLILGLDQLDGGSGGSDSSATSELLDSDTPTADADASAFAPSGITDLETIVEESADPTVLTPAPAVAVRPIEIPGLLLRKVLKVEGLLCEYVIITTKDLSASVEPLRAAHADEPDPFEEGRGQVKVPGRSGIPEAFRRAPGVRVPPDEEDGNRQLRKGLEESRGGPAARKVAGKHQHPRAVPKEDLPEDRNPVPAAVEIGGGQYQHAALLRHLTAAPYGSMLAGSTGFRHGPRFPRRVRSPAPSPGGPKPLRLLPVCQRGTAGEGGRRVPLPAGLRHRGQFLLRDRRLRVRPRGRPPASLPAQGRHRGAAGFDPRAGPGPGSPGRPLPCHPSAGKGVPGPIRLNRPPGRPCHFTGHRVQCESFFLRTFIRQEREMQILLEIVLDTVEFLTLTFGIIGLAASLLFLLSPQRIRSLSDWFNRIVDLGQTIKFIDTPIETEGLFIRHRIPVGIILLAASVFVGLFLFVRLEVEAVVSAFASPEHSTILIDLLVRVFVLTGRIAAVLGFLLGIFLLLLPEAVKTLNRRVSFWLSGESMLKRLEAPQMNLDTFLMEHPIWTGSVGLIASAVLVVLAAVNLMHD